MTISGKTVCSVIQSFPVLLILAQNGNKCLTTPFIYKPPSPTHSPEYYEAFDALIQSLFNQGCHDHYSQQYGYGRKWSEDYTSTIAKPCYNYPGIGHGYSVTHGYPYEAPNHGYPGHGHGYTTPGYVYKSMHVVNASADPEYKYAKNHITNIKQKYKVVILKPRRGLRRSQKLQLETCETHDGGVGSCINVYQCEPYLKLLKDTQRAPSVTQLLKKVHCGFEGNNPKVCCPRPGIPTVPPTQAPVTEGTQPPTTEPPRPSGKSLSGDEDYVDAFPEPPICGTSSAQFTRVVGGVNAKLGDFPWMALLGYKYRGGPTVSWKCGGSLITSRHVLTAAHCINGLDSLYLVRLGELDLEKEDDGAAPIDVLIKTKIEHENYSRNSLTNDIGVLVLQQDVTFTKLIHPICIPLAPELRSNSYVNYNPMIAGWGSVSYRGPSASRLQALQLPVVTNEYCARVFAPYKEQTIDDRVLCAGYEHGGRDACQGDSGGPLMQPVWNSKNFTTPMYQIGVVSYGKKCAEPGFPGVYTRVTKFIPWLEEKVLGKV